MILDSCVNQFPMAGIESTNVGYQYWFVGKDFLDGRTLKMSVVAPHQATHPPHRYQEDEFFFVLEGKAEFFLDGERRTVEPYATLKYLVIKKSERK